MRQLHGPFTAGEEIISSAAPFSHLGIEAPPYSILVINNEEIQICYRGVLELENCSINSIYFKNDVSYAIITFT